MIAISVSGRAKKSNHSSSYHRI